MDTPPPLCARATTYTALLALLLVAGAALASFHTDVFVDTTINEPSGYGDTLAGAEGLEGDFENQVATIHSDGTVTLWDNSTADLVGEFLQVREDVGCPSGPYLNANTHGVTRNPSMTHLLPNGTSVVMAPEDSTAGNYSIYHRTTNTCEELPGTAPSGSVAGVSAWDDSGTTTLVEVTTGGGITTIPLDTLTRTSEGSRGDAVDLCGPFLVDDRVHFAWPHEDNDAGSVWRTQVAPGENEFYGIGWTGNAAGDIDFNMGCGALRDDDGTTNLFVTAPCRDSRAHLYDLEADEVQATIFTEGWDSDNTDCHTNGEVAQFADSPRFSMSNEQADQRTYLFNLQGDSATLFDAGDPDPTNFRGATTLGTPENGSIYWGPSGQDQLMLLWENPPERVTLTPDTTITTPLGGGVGVDTSTHLRQEDVSVYLRDRGTDPTNPENRLQRIDAKLTTLINEVDACEDTRVPQFTSFSMEVTADNFVVAFCGWSEDAAPTGLGDSTRVDLRNQDLTLSNHQMIVEDDQDATFRAASYSGNNVSWTNRSQEAAIEADPPLQTWGIEDRLAVDVDYSRTENGWLHVTGDGGLVTFEGLNDQRLPVAEDDTITAYRSGVIHNSTLWLVDPSADQVDVWTVDSVNGGYVDEGLSTGETWDLDWVDLSEDGRYVALHGDRVKVIDAETLTTGAALDAILEVDPDAVPNPRDVAIDACNNNLYVLEADALHQFDIAEWTDCHGFGGTDSTGDDGENEGPFGTEEGDTAFEGEEEATTTDDEGNTVESTDSTDEEDTTDPDDAFEPQEQGFFGDAFIQQIADGFGITLLGARVMLAGFLITAFAISGGQVAGAGGAVAGGGGAAIITLGVGWLPVWVFVGMVIVALALIVFKGR